jgi:hypothetical protein
MPLSISHHNAVRFGRYHLEDPEGSRRRPQPGRALPLEASNTGVDSRCLEHVAMPATDQNVAAERRRPDETRPRFVRAEAHLHRSLASPGGLDVNADAIPTLCNCRLDTTDRPHGIGTGDVATTVPAETTR